MVGPALIEKPLHVFDVCTDPADHRAIFLYEVYGDRGAFEAHMASAHFKAFDGAVARMVESKAVRIFERVEAMSFDAAGAFKKSEYGEVVMFNIRRLSIILLVALICTVNAAPISAQSNYPSKPIRISFLLRRAGSRTLSRG